MRLVNGKVWIFFLFFRCLLSKVKMFVFYVKCGSFVFFFDICLGSLVKSKGKNRNFDIWVCYIMVIFKYIICLCLCIGFILYSYL